MKDKNTYLSISSAKIPNTTMNIFHIFLLKRVSRHEDSVSWTSIFSIRYIPELVAHDVEVGLNDTLINFCTNPLVDGARLWRGPRENDKYFFSCFIMALTTVGDLVIDIVAAISMNFTSLMSLIWIQPNHFVNIWYFLQIIDFFVGNSICACRSIGTHVLILESDKKLFGVVLQPMMSFAPPPPSPQTHVPVKRDQRRLLQWGGVVLKTLSKWVPLIFSNFIGQYS